VNIAHGFTPEATMAPGIAAGGSLGAHDD
jgi:hypothetical protein